MKDDLQDFPVSSLFRGIEGPRSPDQRNAAQDLANAKNGLRILGFVLYEKYPEPTEPTSDRPTSAPPVFSKPNKPARWLGGVPVETD
jgi:hypothetical protein